MKNKKSKGPTENSKDEEGVTLPSTNQNIECEDPKSKGKGKRRGPVPTAPLSRNTKSNKISKGKTNKVGTPKTKRSYNKKTKKLETNPAQ